MFNKTSIQTYSGRWVDVTNPEARDIYIIDIAHSLANICRFTGQVKRFYSVGEHCINISDLVYKLTGDPFTAMWGLLHDAPEAYIGDVSAPLKSVIRSLYKPLEDKFDSAICAAFGLLRTQTMIDTVDYFDKAIRYDEARALMTPWDGMSNGLGINIVPIGSRHETTDLYMARFHDLTSKCLGTFSKRTEELRVGGAPNPGVVSPVPAPLSQ
jgi:hypothetical protein